MNGAERKRGGLFHVLVVDDDEAMRELWMMECERWRPPVRVSLARDGFHAIVIMAEDPPDVVVTDLQMPNLDGRQMIEVMRSNPPYDAIPVIAVSGSDDMQDLETAPVIACYPKTSSFSRVRLLVQGMLNVGQTCWSARH